MVRIGVHSGLVGLDLRVSRHGIFMFGCDKGVCIRDPVCQKYISATAKTSPEIR